MLVSQIMKNRNKTDEDLYKALIIDDLGKKYQLKMEDRYIIYTRSDRK